MISDGLKANRWVNSLRLRMVFMMTLALFPIGVIAVTQTTGVTRAAKETAELTLLLMTEQSAADQRFEIERALGTAQALSELLPELAEDNDTCIEMLASVAEGSGQYSLVGILPRDGMMTCNSVGQSIDLSDYDPLARNLALGKTSVTVSESGIISQRSVIIISEPYFDDNGEIAGFITVSLPHDALIQPPVGANENGLSNLITLNKDGDVLTTTRDRSDLSIDLPRSLELNELALSKQRAFSDKSRDGRNLIYAVVPIENSPLTVVGIWTGESAITNQLRNNLPAGVFPALMWLMSLAVALFAVHRLVTRHIKLLGRQMTHFAANRRAVKAISTAEMPTELRDIQDAFLQMAVSILHDEARLEDAVREKNVLLKEIHHRVKNNLQLISSIVNMQIRETKNVETKHTLRRVQDRVLSLATIHRDLYQSSDSGRVNVGALISEIVEKTLEIGAESSEQVDVTSDVSDVLLYPDQAVPLSLLASEAATNAMKYLGAPDGERPYINVSLARDNDGRCDFVFENSVGADTGAESSGLGGQLMNAFAIQLGAKIDIDQTPTIYRMHISFITVDFEHEATVY